VLICRRRTATAPCLPRLFQVVVEECGQLYSPGCHGLEGLDESLLKMSKCTFSKSVAAPDGDYVLF